MAVGIVAGSLCTARDEVQRREVNWLIQSTPPVENCHMFFITHAKSDFQGDRLFTILVCSPC